MANENTPKIPVIAIDFGTTNSYVGVVRDEEIQIVTDGHGNMKVPSYVSFTDYGCSIGEDALKQASLNPCNTIFGKGLKRVLGINLEDFSARSTVGIWPFELVPENETIKIKVSEGGKMKSFSPEEICGMILTELKKMASEYLGEDVSNVVLTIPNNFSTSQRQSIVDASRLAGLNVVRIISDSIAAGIACGLDQSTETQNVLIFDLGGGKFDVTILNVEDGVFEVKATSGDCHLGGEDFDSRLVAFFVEEIRRKHGRDISEDAGALRRLRAGCERAKCALSSSEEACVQVEDLLEGVTICETLTRASFEELCDDMFLLILQHLDSLLLVADLSRSEIDQVVLVGGSTRIPKVRELLTSFFEREIFSRAVLPEVAVVVGATMQAAAVCAEGPIVMAPLSIGIEAPGAVMTVIIPRKSSLPVRKTVNYTTYRDFQQAITVKVFEGERLLAPYNRALGTLCLEGIPPMPRGLPQIDITFDLDASGLLTVTAVEASTGITSRIAVATSKDRLTGDQVQQLVAEADMFRAEDECEKDRLVARDLFETCLTNVKLAMNAPDVVGSMEEENHMWYMHLLHQEHQWLKENPMADRTVYSRKTVDLQIVYLSIIVDIFHEDLDHETRTRREG